MLHDNSHCPVGESPSTCYILDATRNCWVSGFVNRRWTWKEPIFDDKLIQTMISKFSCSQTETRGMPPHSNFTWGINTWKSHEKVFIGINTHLLLWFAQVRSRKPSRHPEPLTFLWFSHKYMQRALQQFKKKKSSHYMIAWPYTNYPSYLGHSHLQPTIEYGLTWTFLGKKDLIVHKCQKPTTIYLISRVIFSSRPNWPLRLFPADKVSQLLSLAGS